MVSECASSRGCSDNPIIDIQNEESDESEMETIMEE
ncbi:hypothetical protein Tco_0645063, partial [Tanacetum coccineum]